MEFGVVDIILTIFLACAIAYAAGLFSSSKISDQPAKKPPHLSSSADPGSTQTTSGDVPLLTFLFGSESGTAENLAYDLSEESKIHGFKSRVVCLEDYQPSDLLDDKFVVFIVATHGEGEPTSNAEQFWEYVTSNLKERDPNDLSHLTYAVFGLGNRQYRHFNAVGKRIDAELAAMKAERLLPLDLGDDDGTMEEDVERWCHDLWAASRLKYLNIAEDVSTAASFNSTYDLTVYPQDSKFVQDYKGGLDKVARFFNDPVKEHRTAIVSVTDAYELRQSGDDVLESTVHVDLSLEGVKINYRTADNLGIHPQNSKKIANLLSKRLDIDMSTIFNVKTTSNRKLPFPNPCSVEDALLYFLDIQSLVKHKFAQILSNYATDPKEKSKLLFYAQQDEGRVEFNKMRYSWAELLLAYPSIDLPFAHFIEMVPRLQPRSYTISSSSKVNPKQISITASRVFEHKANGNEFIGVTSDHLCQYIDLFKKAREIPKLVVYVKSSLFRLPVRAGTPIIMIGPGTGLAPFRAFIQEFRTRPAEHKFGDTILYFGCRHPEKDYIYKDELEQAEKDGVLTNLYVAFSRIQDKPKVYVQDIIKTHAERLWGLIDSGAYIFVCGGTAMGRDVFNVFVQVCSQHGNMTEAAAEAFVDKMIRQNRYVQELWA